MPVGFFLCIYLWMTFYLDVYLLLSYFIIGVNVWWVYLAPHNIPRATVLTLGNKAVFGTYFRTLSLSIGSECFTDCMLAAVPPSLTTCSKITELRTQNSDLFDFLFIIYWLIDFFRKLAVHLFCDLFLIPNNTEDRKLTLLSIPEPSDLFIMSRCCNHYVIPAPFR